MKSLSLIVLFILTIFVITSKANIEGQINEKMPIQGGGYKVWLNEVNGFDQNDPVNGYAGILGKPITSIRVDGGTAYRVHLLDFGKWLGKITKNDQKDINSYAGNVNGKPIDGFVIGGGIEYAAHILGGDWLPVVNGYNLSDPKNGYAGIIGKEIDAIMIRGRTYATSYTELPSSDTELSSSDECSVQGGTCISSNVCNGGNIIKGLCSDQAAGNCCIPNKNKKSGGGNSFNTLYIIGIVLAVLIVIIVILYIYFALSKQWIKRSITTSIKNIPTINNNNNDNSNHEEDLPPSYFDIVNESVDDDISNLISNNTSMKKITSSNTHSQVKLPNSNSVNSSFHSGIGMSKSERYNEKKGFHSDIKSSKSEMIHPTTLKNDDDDDDDDIIIERINKDDRRVTFTVIERSKAVLVNNDDTENNQNETNDITITIPSVERSKAVTPNKQ